MSGINYLAVVVAAVAAFVVGSLWYSPFLFGQEWMELRGMNPAAMADMKMPAWKMLIEFVRGLVVAYVLARFVLLLGGRRLEGCAAAWSLGVDWVSCHASCRLRHLGEHTLEALRHPCR